MFCMVAFFTDDCHDLDLIMKIRPTYPIFEKLMVPLRTRRFLRPLWIERLLYYRDHRHSVRTTERYRQEACTAELLSKLRNMNLVFTVTAGRTGTLFVCNLFSLRRM